jgi:hypothetical protein
MRRAPFPTPCVVPLLPVLLLALQVAAQSPADSLVVQPRRAALVDPRRAFGGAIDGHTKGDHPRLLARWAVDTMRSVGFHQVSARLRTELAGDAWHWNPRGTWSDAARQQGYWTSSDRPGAPIEVSYGYKLPRRGNTIDQAAQDGFSRLTDGDTVSFWKSNPYLKSEQWVVLDFGDPVRAHSVDVTWGRPRARRIAVEMHTDWLDPARITDEGYWTPFVPGTAVNALRIRLLDPERVDTADWRDGAGVAIRELAVRDAQGRDLVVHAPNAKAQTHAYVSSTDPWHRASDLDPTVEQPGLDWLFRSPWGRRVMVPVGVLYDTPENAAALVRYARARGYPLREVELGEEPEQQYGDPRDFAFLYRLVADSLRAVDRRLVLGGASMVSGSSTGDTDSSSSRWTGRFVRALRPGDLQFFTFEWYPFDDACHPVPPLVRGHERTLRTALDLFAQAGVPRNIPWMMTELGFSPHASQAEVDLAGAVVNTEAIATFLAWGGERAYVYRAEPTDVATEGCSTGNLMLFAIDTLGGFDYHVPAFHALRMMARHWMPEGGRHALHDVTTPPALRAWAAKAPSGRWRMLVLNRSSTDTVTVAVDRRYRRAVRYGRDQYAWGGQRPTRDLPPVREPVRGRVVVPPLAILVLED